MYQANARRYASMDYRRLGRSGLKFSAVSLGLWHNFGGHSSLETAREMLITAFDLGITHFDLANNYGPPYGSAEENFGKLYSQNFKPYRDELIISTKAGYDMWPGPYGDWGSRKYLLASLDQSLTRMKLDYVDIFYSHRPDPETPLEETMGALATAVKQGKAIYAAISNYTAAQTRASARIMRDLGVPLLIHQPRYSMLDRWIEVELLEVLSQEGLGCIPFSPLAQGLLSDKYLQTIPDDSRMRTSRFLKESSLTEARLKQLKALNQIAQNRGQSLAQMALVWVLRHPAVSSVLIGASGPEQIKENVACLNQPVFSDTELDAIEAILSGESN